MADDGRVVVVTGGNRGLGLEVCPPRVSDHHPVADHHLVLRARGNLGYGLHRAVSRPRAVHPDDDCPEH